MKEPLGVQEDASIPISNKINPKIAMSVCIIDFDPQDHTQYMGGDDVSLSSNLLYVSDDSWLPGTPVGAARARGTEQPHMLDETLVNHCMGCSRPFDIVVSKHHCRGCGQVLCSSCSSFKVAMDGYPERQRACLSCVSKIVDKAKQNKSSPPSSPIAPKAASFAPIKEEFPDKRDDNQVQLDTNLWSPQAVVQSQTRRPRRGARGLNIGANKSIVLPSTSQHDAPPPRRIFQGSVNHILGQSADRPSRGAKDNTPTRISDENENVTTIRFGSGSFDRKMSALQDMTNLGGLDNAKIRGKSNIMKNSYINSATTKTAEGSMNLTSRLLVSPAAESRDGDGDSMDFLIDEDAAFADAIGEECDLSTSPMSSPLFARMSPIPSQWIPREDTERKGVDGFALSADAHEEDVNNCQEESVVVNGSFDHSVVFETLVEEYDVVLKRVDKYVRSADERNANDSMGLMTIKHLGALAVVLVTLVLALFSYSEEILKWEANIRVLESSKEPLLMIPLLLESESTPFADAASGASDNLTPPVEAIPNFDLKADVESLENSTIIAPAIGEVVEVAPLVIDSSVDSAHIEAAQEAPLDPPMSTPEEESLSPSSVIDRRQIPHRLSWMRSSSMIPSSEVYREALVLRSALSLSPPVVPDLGVELAVAEKCAKVCEEPRVGSGLVPAEFTYSHDENRASSRPFYAIRPAIITSLARALFRKVGELLRAAVTSAFRKAYVYFTQQEGALAF